MADASVFHVELRQFPNTARRFNLTDEELRGEILGPWLQGKPVTLEDRRWSPDKARLTIYEGPALSTDQMGLGRGWANVTKNGRDVTAAALGERTAAPADEATHWIKAEIVRLGETTPPTVVALLNARHPAWRASDRLAVAERAVWEQLHNGQVRMLRDGKPVEAAEWEEIILAWATWSSPGVTLSAI